jgi:hypothetical protein
MTIVLKDAAMMVAVIHQGRDREKAGFAASRVPEQPECVVIELFVMVLAPPALGIEWQRQQFRIIDLVEPNRSVEVAAVEEGRPVAAQVRNAIANAGEKKGSE